MMGKLYWAYGSNLNVKQMKIRCPKAKKIAAFPLEGGQLVFRGVADVISDPKSLVMGGLWEITPDCEKALDAYEGVRGDAGMYTKEYIDATHRGEEISILWYKMNSEGVMPPSQHYFDVIAQGFDDFGLDKSFLHEALERSWKGKNKTADLRERYLRKGRPSLARLTPPRKHKKVRAA